MAEYTATFFCSNCGERTPYEVPKGTATEDFAEDLICEKCGCKTLQKSYY